MRESQYIDDYLAHDGRYTVGTFLAYTLRGRAKLYAGRYKSALENAIARRIRAGTVEPCRSVGGMTAYRRVAS